MKVKLLEHGIMPKKGHADDAGYDIYVPVKTVINPGETVVIDTGVCVEIRKGYAGMFVVRSSVSKKGIIIQPPMIDYGYTGELHIMAANIGTKKFSVDAGDRLCSLVVFPIYTGKLELVDELADTERGTAWSGSTGK